MECKSYCPLDLIIKLTCKLLVHYRSQFYKRARPYIWESYWLLSKEIRIMFVLIFNQVASSVYESVIFQDARDVSSSNQTFDKLLSLYVSQFC